MSTWVYYPKWNLFSQWICLCIAQAEMSKGSILHNFSDVG